MRSIESTDGVTVALHELGGSGPPLMICHATGFHGLAYQQLAKHLVDSYTVWAIDFRGQGSATAPASGDFGWPGMGEDLLACVDALELDSLVAFGHSMGGSAILLAEMARPGTIEHAYLYEPIVFPQAYLSARTENPLAGPARRRRAVFPTKQAALERYASRPPLGILDPGALADYVEYGFVATEGGEVQLACLPEHEARIFESEEKMTLETLAGLHLPVVVGAGPLTGEHPSPAAMAPAIADAIVGGRVITYDDLGHFGPLQDPARIAADILAANQV